MRSIDIFVAGAKNLDEYRDALKILANELNVENKLKNKDVLVRICDYKDIGDNQKDYDDFITHNAAGLFAIIVDDFGVETQKELKLAAQRFVKSKRSMVKVFIKKSSDSDKMNIIYNFIKLILGDGHYGEEFNEITEFKTRARKYLKEYIRQAHREEKVNKKYIKVGVGVVAILIAVFGFMLNWFIPKDNILLFVGGGSARNVIESVYDLNLKNRENTMVIDMPSGNTWSVIMEDLLYEKSNDEKKIRYKPISMSASKATDSSFVINESLNAYQIGSIIEILVGYDDLVLYFDSEEAKKRGFKDRITKKQFSELLRECKNDSIWNLFTTRSNSGTLMTYCSLTDVKIESLNPMIYSDKVSLKEVCNVSKRNVNNPILLLGSEAYASLDIEKENVVRLKICEDEKLRSIVKKPIYLYFAAEMVSSKELKIDESIERFLREIAPISKTEGISLDSLLNKKINKGRVNRGLANTNVLININDLEDF